MTTDYQKAIAAFRESIREGVVDWQVIRAGSNLLAALDAARGQAVPAGYSLRDYFAAKAMQGMLAAAEPYNTGELARYAYEVADAMLAAARDESIIDIGGESVPRWIVEYANALTTYFAERGGGSWAICGVQSMEQAPPAAEVPAANVTPMRQPRTDLARLVESINAAVYANGDGLSVTEAIGALELAKLELLREQEQ